MDELVILLSDESPVALLARITEATNILNATATAFGFEIQHFPGKTEVAIVLRSPGKQATI